MRHLAVIFVACVSGRAARHTVAPVGAPQVTIVATSTAQPLAPVATETPLVIDLSTKLRDLHISRGQLESIVRDGPGPILQVVDVRAAFVRQRFIGWEFLGFLAPTAMANADVRPGDILVSINSQTIARPEHLQRVWRQFVTRGDHEFRFLRDKRTFSIWLRVDETDQPAASPMAGPMTNTMTGGNAPQVAPSSAP